MVLLLVDREIFLQESQELLSGLSSLFSSDGLDGLGTDHWLLAVEFGELTSEVGRKRRGLGWGRSGIVSDGSGVGFGLLYEASKAGEDGRRAMSMVRGRGLQGKGMGRELIYISGEMRWIR